VSVWPLPFPFQPRVYVLADVEAVDIAFHNSLQYVLENDPQTLDLTFSVLEETFGDVSGEAGVVDGCGSMV